MKRVLYRSQDYAFGQQMLTLRTTIGLTQAGLAELLRVTRHAVGDWEAGCSYPKTEHLKALIALGVQQRAFASGQESEEIRTLWQAAHQKVLLDELWLHNLLNQQTTTQDKITTEQICDVDPVTIPPARNKLRGDWSNAPDVRTFYGREEELALLSRWVVDERCRVVSVLGMGGIGKSSLAATLMHQVADQFEVVIWQSLHDASSCEMLLNECLQVLAPQELCDGSLSLERRQSLLLECLRSTRVLLIYDNLETFLEGGQGMGQMRSGYESFARMLRQIAETRHQSCLLLTSREKPIELVPLEGRRLPVRALRLAGLDGHAGTQLLAQKDVVGSLHDQMRLVEMYQGNPLTLKIVAQTIVDLFEGEIALFLKQGEVIFGGVSDLLSEQVDRLSALERVVFFWLAILRDPVSLRELQAVVSVPGTPVQVLEALNGLSRRNLIECGQRAGSFTLHPVALEYATARLMAEATSDTEHGRLASFVDYELYPTQVREHGPDQILGFLRTSRVPVKQLVGLTDAKVQGSRDHTYSALFS